ncbi:MAG: hypothetical protein ABI321_14065 [Polyangia bacterium]
MLVSFVVALIASAAVYAPWLDNDFIWDDFVQISDNPAVTSGVPLSRWFTDRETTSTRADYNTRIWRPLRGVAMRAVWRMSDATPKHRTRVFHGVNLLLYLVGGVLVLVLLRRIVTDDLAALLGAVAWLLLPVHAEDVLYASAFGDLLSFDLQLVGLLFALRVVDAASVWRLVAALACCAVGLLVKEMGITTLLLLPAYVVSQRPALLWRRRTIVLVGLHALVAFAYLAVRTKLLGRVGQDDVHAGETVRAILDAPWLLGQYVRLAFSPLGHAPDYGMHGPTRLPSMLAMLVFLPLFVAASFRARGGLRWGVWFFVIALVPVLHFVPLWTLLADRFLLLPSVGLALAVAAALSFLPERARRLEVGVAVVVALVYLGATSLEARRFRNDESLFAFGVEEVPDSGLSQHNLGLDLLKRGEFVRALEHLQRAEALGRRDPRLYVHLAGAFEATADLANAEKATDLALHFDPELGGAYLQRASLERGRGDLDAAERDLELARTHHGNDRQLRRTRALIAVSRGRVREAYDLYVGLAREAGNDPILWQHAAECARHEHLDAGANDAAKRCLALAPDRAPCAALAD